MNRTTLSISAGMAMATATAIGCSSGGGSYFAPTGDGGTALDGGPTSDAKPGTKPAPDGELDPRLNITATKPTTSNVLLIHPGTATFGKIPDVGNVFLSVTVQVNNDSYPSPLPTSGGHFELRTDTNTVYSFYGPANNMDNACGSGRGSVVAGGSSKPCSVAFEYPASETPVAVMFYASTASHGRTEVEIPTPKPGPLGFCDQVNHSTGKVSADCEVCLETHCRRSGMAFEPNTNSSFNLPEGTCTEAPYCTCERDAYERIGKGSFYEDFEGCADTQCAMECLSP